MKTYSKEDMQTLLVNNDMAVVRGIEAIYARQTSDERVSQTTSHNNGRGFNGRDAKFGSSLALKIKEWRAADPATRYPFPLSTRPGGQLECGRRLIMKYAAQLAMVANEKVELANAKAAAELASERAAIQAEEINEFNEFSEYEFSEFREPVTEDDFIVMA